MLLTIDKKNLSYSLRKPSLKPGQRLKSGSDGNFRCGDNSYSKAVVPGGGNCYNGNTGRGKSTSNDGIITRNGIHDNGVGGTALVRIAALVETELDCSKAI